MLFRSVASGSGPVGPTSCGFLCQTSAYRLVAQPLKISTLTRVTTSARISVVLVGCEMEPDFPLPSNLIRSNYGRAIDKILSKKAALISLVIILSGILPAKLFMEVGFTRILCLMH